MKEHHLDKKLKANLENYVSGVDMDQLWSDIEDQVDTLNQQQKRKRRSFLWLWFGAGFLLTTSLGLGWFAMKPTVVLSEQQIVSPKSSETNDPLLSLTTIKPELTISNHAHQAEQVAPIIELHRSIQTQDLVLPEVEKYPSSDNNANLLLFSTKEKSAIPVSTINKQQLKSEKKQIQSILNSNILSALSPLDQVATALESSNILFEKNLAAVQDSVLGQLQETLHKDQPSFPNSKSRKYQDPFSLAFGVHSGLSLANRNLSDKTGDAFSYLERREATEKVLETVHLGMSVDLLHRSGFELSLGFQLSQINEKFNFQGSLIEYDTIENGLYGYHVNPGGDTTFVYSQIINSKETFYETQIFNKYTMLEVPLLIAYHWQEKSWSLGLQAGVITNLSLKTSGKIFDPLDNIVDIEKQQETFFRSSIGLSYYFGLSGRYQLNDNLQITASPFFRYIPKSITQDSYSLNQKYKLTGFNIGLRYQL